MSRLRIIAGEWGGHPLQYPRGAQLRPTSERLRESLFSALAPELPGARFADLFAGTGAVGLEALSRGAEFCALVERHPRCVEAIRANVAKLRAQDRALVQSGAAETVWPRLAAQHGPFDLVFLDPPYDYRAWPRLLRILLGAPGSVSPAGWVLIQHPRQEPVPPPWEPQRVQSFGESCISWLRPPPAESAAEE